MRFSGEIFGAAGAAAPFAAAEDAEAIATARGAVEDS